jgi:hypothetical protein
LRGSDRRFRNCVGPGPRRQTWGDFRVEIEIDRGENATIVDTMEGWDISNRPTLIDVVAEAGLERQRAESVLDSDEGLNAIKVANEQVQRFRVDGVPFFILNGEIKLPGAQPPDVFLAAINQVIGSK